MAGIGSNIFASAGASVDAGGGADPAPLAAATYGPSGQGSAGPLSPRHGHGLGFWLAVGGVVALVLVRQSLPR
jgi:hypothetical protein